VSRIVAVLMTLAFAAGVAACSLDLIPTSPLTADEWALCQEHWRDGLDSPQRDEPNGSTWYFNNMGMRNAPGTIRVCRLAAARQ
jgi:hypothetical protein